MSPATSKPSVFISYAHKDGMDFTRRLAFALGLYLDVFWDLRLPAGEFAPELHQQIESRDFFLLVMSPYSLRLEGLFGVRDGWCRKELKHAQKCSKSIALAKIYHSTGSKLEREISGRYTYGDFTTDFEQGFRRLTEMFLGQPYSSWEGLPSLSDTEILNNLRQGRIPALIGKEIFEWVVVEKLFAAVETYATTRQGIYLAVPRTPSGVVDACRNLIQQFADANDGIGAYLAAEVIKLVKKHSEQGLEATASEHILVGEAAFNMIKSTYSMLQNNAIGAGAARQALQIQATFHFDVAEKLRELILIHARRSRYLY